MRNIYIISLLLIWSIITLAHSEEKYFDPPYKNISRENLVTTYGANGYDDLNDSVYLQNAINDVSAHPKGGKIFIPFGRYYFSNIEMKSNVHIEIEAGTSIAPAKVNPWKTHSIFILNGSIAPIKNVSICGLGGKFNVNLDKVKNKNVTVFELKNVQNFKLENAMIHDNYTNLPSILLGFGDFKGHYTSPKNGIIRNISNFKAHYNFGLVQIETGSNIYLENLSGQGGITLKLESKYKKLNDLQIEGIFNISAHNISCTYGNAAVLISPHVQRNGSFHINDVYTSDCGFTVIINKGYSNNKERGKSIAPGYFSEGSYIRNVVAIFGERAQIKKEHSNLLNSELKNLLSKKSNPDGVSYTGPSIAAILNNSEKTKKGYYEVLVENINAIGFEYQEKLTISESNY